MTELVVRCGIYCRISRDWEGEAKGVTRQREDCLKIAARLGWTVVDEYIDNDQSISKFARKKRGAHSEYARLLSDIEARRLEAVVVWMDDRFQRELAELEAFFKVCERVNLTRMASAGGELDISNPDQRMTLRIRVAIAAAEVEKMSLRLRSRNQQAAEKGEKHFGGQRPFGDAWKGEWAVTEEQAAKERELLREAARRIIAGDSLRGIVLDWEKRGIRTPAGKYKGEERREGSVWRNVNLRRCLLSPRMVGIRTYQGTLYDEHKFDPILSTEEWQAVKAILEDPSRVDGHRGGTAKYLLTGIAYCGKCDKKLSVRKIRGKRVYYCSPGAPTGGCGTVGRQAEPIEKLIEQAIFKATEGDLWKRLQQVEQEDPTAPLYEQLARDQGLLDRLEDKMAQELISEAAYKRNRAEIERRMEDTRNWLDRKRGRQVMIYIPKNLREVWPDFSMDRRRAIVKAVLARVVVLPQRGGSRTFHPERIVAEWRDAPEALPE
ncbi:MAG TPA: recombinase family protein [Actinomycetes bacterium]